MRSLPVQPGATFAKGDFPIWTATGLAMIAANTNYAPTTNTTRIAGKTLGPALNPQTGVAYTHMEVEIAQPDTQFPIALLATVVPTLAMIGQQYELKNDANGIPRVDTTATTNPAVRIVGFVPTSGTPDNTAWPDGVAGAVAGALAWCEFLGSASTFSGAR